MADTNEGLVGYWKFDESGGDVARDSGSGGNNGYLIGNPIFTDGKIGNALIFNGANQYINFGNILNIGASNFAVSVWIKTGYSGNQPIIAKSIANNLFGRWWMVLNGDDLEVGLEFSGKNSITVDFTTSTLRDGKWHNIIMNVDRLSLFSLFVDSNLVGSVNVSEYRADDLNQSVDLYIGAYGNPEGNGTYSGYYFNGMIDDVRVYNRSLSSEDIGDLFFSAVNLNTIKTLGIALDMGAVPVLIKLNAKLSSFGVITEMGVIPPKNYFRTNISSLGISGDLAPDSILEYLIH